MGFMGNIMCFYYKFHTLWGYLLTVALKKVECRLLKQ